MNSALLPACLGASFQARGDDCTVRDGHETNLSRRHGGQGVSMLTKDLLHSVRYRAVQRWRYCTCGTVRYDKVRSLSQRCVHVWLKLCHGVKWGRSGAKIRTRCTKAQRSIQVPLSPTLDVTGAASRLRHRPLPPLFPPLTNTGFYHTLVYGEDTPSCNCRFCWSTKTATQKKYQSGR